MSSDIEENTPLQPDSEDELDWEEVEVPEHQPQLEITLQVGKGKSKEAEGAAKKKGIPHAERLLRIDCHKIHTLALITNARVRNQWLNDPLLHARLLSLTPLSLQNAFSAIHKSRVPDHNQRGRMFEAALRNLTDWWANSFFDVLPEGHIRNRTFDEVRQKLEIRGLHIPNPNDSDEGIDEETLQDILGTEFEAIRSSKSLMKHALMRNGSRDVGAQLFTALCRALNIPARLVVSIQSVPWQAGVGKPKPKYPKKPKDKGKAKAADTGSEATSNNESLKLSDLQSSDSKVKSAKAKGKERAQPIIRLRKTKDKGRVLGGPSQPPPDPSTTHPVFWTEVFSRADTKWFPVDPVRCIVGKRKVFDPTPASTNTAANAQPTSSLLPAIYNSKPSPARLPPGSKVENRMLYVLAFEEDGFARDVTRRYAREYGSKVAKAQGGSNAPNIGGGGRGRQAWWEQVLGLITRPYRLHRDDIEDQEFEDLQMQEGMPTTLSGFKDHPLYVLVRHLKQNETIYPPPPVTPEVGKFRGEPVYPRSAVVSLKTSENWMRSTGRSVITGSQPMKLVKVHASTVSRMRELEVLKDELRVAGEDGEGEGSSSAGAEIMQGLYAFSQTEPYVPEPVVDGIVPKNSFGNIDLYVPSMLPRGAAHIPFKGTAKVARKLGFDFAEAVTGFEFKKRRAFPILEGIVVASENEPTILEAFWQAEQEAEEKARIKREERVLKRWTKLIHGLRIRKRLHEQYGTKSNTKSNEQHTTADAAAIPNDKEPSPLHDDADLLQDSSGGFLAGADKVVQAFHLPKNTHVILPSTSSGYEIFSASKAKPKFNPKSMPFRSIPPVKEKENPRLEPTGGDEESSAEELEEQPILDFQNFMTYDLDHMDVDEETDGPTALEVESSLNGDLVDQENAQSATRAPKTMEEIAAEAAAAAEARLADSIQKQEEVLPDIPNGTPRNESAATTSNHPPRPTRNRKTEVEDASSTPAAGGRTLRNKKGTGTSGVGSTPVTITLPATTKRKRGGTTSKSTPTTPNNKRKRARTSTGRGKRTRKRKSGGSDDEDEDEDVTDEDEGSDPGGFSGVDEAGLPDDGADETGLDETPAVVLAPTATVPATSGGRTLRPRAIKSAAQVERERKEEIAFRSATAR